jgi:hypothetical protein
MQYVLGNMLNGGGGLNADGLALDLQFALDKTLTARKGPTPVFTRASSATFVGSNGLIQTAATNIPRFDHTSAGVCRGLLIEESRTNSITGSNAFNTWTLGNSTVASSSVVTPEGTADAWKLVEDSLTANHIATRSFTPVSGTTYTASVWLKSAENSFAFVGLTGGGFPTTFISVNLSTGAVSTAVGTPVGATSVAYPNGWWRVSFSLAATASSSSVIDIRLSRDGNWANRSYLGNGVNGMYCYGGQVEAGSFATSYIPTTTGSVVRSADVCSITGANFTSFFGSSPSEFTYNTAFTHLLTSAIAPNVRVLVDFANGGNRRWLYGDAQANNLFQGKYFEVANNVNIGVASSYPYRVALALTPTTNFFSVNGATAGSGVTSGTLLSNVTGLQIGQTGSYHFQYLRGYKKRLSNAKLQALTA